ARIAAEARAAMTPLAGRRRGPRAAGRSASSSAVRASPDLGGLRPVSGGDDALGHRVDVVQDAVYRNRGVPLRRAGIGLWQQHQAVNAEFRIALDRSLVQRPGWRSE